MAGLQTESSVLRFVLCMFSAGVAAAAVCEAEKRGEEGASAAGQ